jgi:hypothetical protein
VPWAAAEAERVPALPAAAREQEQDRWRAAVAMAEFRSSGPLSRPVGDAEGVLDVEETVLGELIGDDD